MSTTAAPPRPTPPPPADLRKIPALAPLTDDRHVRWVAWSYVLRPPKNGKPGKWDKPPRQLDGSNARNNDPSTWYRYDQVWRAVSAGNFMGLGFVLSGLPGSVLAAIDLDDVRDPQTGALLPWAGAIVAAAASYCEVTPSGTGVRVLGTVTGIPTLHRQGKHAGGGAFELYVCCERYITVSGQVRGLADAWSDITAAVNTLFALLDCGKDKTRSQSAAGTAAAAQVRAGAGVAIELDTLPLTVVELITSATINGKPVSQRGRAFLRVVKALHGKGYAFDSVLELFTAHPNGVADKYSGRLTTELRRVWDKLPPPVADWITRLKYNERGVPIPDLANATLALREAPELAGLLGYDEMERTPVLLRSVPGTTDNATRTRCAISMSAPSRSGCRTPACGGWPRTPCTRLRSWSR